MNPEWSLVDPFERVERRRPAVEGSVYSERNPGKWLCFRSTAAVFESAEPAVVLVSVQSVAAVSVEKLTVVWEDLVTDEAVLKYSELEGVVVGKGV